MDHTKGEHITPISVSHKNSNKGKKKNSNISSDNMFGLAAGFYETYLAPPEVNILIVGSENSGKTALMERMKVMQFRSSVKDTKGAGIKQNGVSKYQGDSISSKFSSSEGIRNRNKKKMIPLHKIRPTIGMNMGKVDAFGCKCVFWDVGGQMRPLWERYYNECHAVIFVIDSMQCRYMCGTNVEQDMKSKEYIRNCREVFENVWNDSRLKSKNVPFLIFATKRDFDEEIEMASLNDHRDLETGQDKSDNESDITLGDHDQLDDEIDTWLDLIDIEKIILTAAASVSEYNDEELSKYGNGQRKSSIKVFGGSAKTGEGVNDAVQWLTDVLKLRFHQNRQHSL